MSNLLLMLFDPAQLPTPAACDGNDKGNGVSSVFNSLPAIDSSINYPRRSADGFDSNSDGSHCAKGVTMNSMGTLINAGAVILGSLVGLVIHRRLPERIVSVVFQGTGLFTLFLGITMASKTGNFLIMVFSIVPGAVIGSWIDIERRMEGLSKVLKRVVRVGDDHFSEGFVTSFLLFCMGSMTILGAIEEGLGGRPNLLLAKSVLDGSSSIALSASLGVGVLFSALPLLLYQGGITLFAAALHQVLTPKLINELTAVGGLLLIGLGINILKIRQLSVLNMLPALPIAAILACFIR
jgi:uncharacterized membrane protein YqgA involved in biofilm formation